MLLCEDVEDAVKAAKAFSLEWERIGWQELGVS
jgi:hypothetical protein